MLNNANRADFVSTVNKLRRHYKGNRDDLTLALTNARRRYVKTKRNKDDARRWAIVVAFSK